MMSVFVMTKMHMAYPEKRNASPANKEAFLNQLARVILIRNWYHSTSTCFHVYLCEYMCSACCLEF